MATDSTVIEEPDAANTGAADGTDDSPPVSVDGLEGLADADDGEAAAIAVAIAAHLRDRQAAAAAAAAADEADDDGEGRRSWRFAGRLEAIGEPANRPPNNAPKNAWAAAGRADQF